MPKDTRKLLFETFWGMGDFTQQNLFLCGMIRQTNPERRRSGSSVIRKTYSNRYSLSIDGESVTVCKNFFLHTFQVSNGRMLRALKKLRTEGRVDDQRGRHVSWKRTHEADLQVVRQHIDSFPAHQSHYTRKHNPNRKYLPDNLNVRLMYKLYVERCKNENLPTVTESRYRDIFNTEFNLHFHSPLKDTCSSCDTFKAKIGTMGTPEDRRIFEEEHNAHLQKAENARTFMKSDAEKSRHDKTTYSFTFDLEKALPFPVLTTSVAYYKRNMYVYNLGCHDLSTGKGYMYAWDETVASRGSQEISSCIIKHINTHAASANKIIMYSDSCTGQNRNIKVTLSLLRLVSREDNGIETIDHKFMVSGHSYLPNDTDFASIENCSKKRTIYQPSDWYSIIQDARTKNAFSLTVLDKDDFNSTKALERSITKRKQNTDGAPASWLKMQWIRVQKNHPYTIFYKETLTEDEPFCKLNVKSAKVGRPPSLANVEMEPLYTTARPVTKEKRKDMQDLLTYIPPVHHAFFQNLTVMEDADDDIGPLEFIEKD